MEKDFDPIRDKAEDLLWPENVDEARWTDVVDRYAEQPGMNWLPPKGLEALKSIACNRGHWEDLGNGYVTRKPKKKRTSAQIIPELAFRDDGSARLTVQPQNAGPRPRIYYAEDNPVSESSNQLAENPLTTAALRVNFLVCDPTGTYETGDPVTWSNNLVIRNRLSEGGGERTVELLVAPRGSIRYTLDGSEPREGTPYNDTQIGIGNDDVLVRVFAEADGLEAKADFKFPAKGDKGPKVDPVKPACIVSRKARSLDSRAKTFEALRSAIEMKATFQEVTLNVGQGAKVITLTIGEMKVSGAFLQGILDRAVELFEPDEPLTMTFRRACFASGHDLTAFADSLGIEIGKEEIEQ